MAGGCCLWLSTVVSTLSSLVFLAGLAVWYTAARFYFAVNDFRYPGTAWAVKYSFAVGAVAVLVGLYYSIAGLLRLFVSAFKKRFSFGYTNSMLAVAALLLVALHAVSAWYFNQPRFRIALGYNCKLERTSNGYSGVTVCVTYKVVEFMAPFASAAWGLVLILALVNAASSGANGDALGGGRRDFEPAAPMNAYSEKFAAAPAPVSQPYPPSQPHQQQPYYPNQYGAPQHQQHQQQQQHYGHPV